MFNKEKWSKEYYLKNKDRILKQTSEWQKKNRKKANAISKKWKLKNPDKVKKTLDRYNHSEIGLKRFKKYRDTHKKERAESFKKYYLENQNVFLVYRRNWVAKNKEKSKQADRTQYARRKKAIGKFTLEEWENKKKEFNYCCADCGRHESERKLTVDHFIPLSKGGTNFISNIEPRCKSCNCSKNNKLR